MNTSFDKVLQNYEEVLNSKGYVWKARGSHDDNFLYVRVETDKSKRVVGLGTTWEDCFKDIIEQLKVKL